MTEQAMRDEFEVLHSRLHPNDKCTRMPNGNYSGWVKQKHWGEFKIAYKHREASNIDLTEEQQQEFIYFVSQWSVHCHFEGQKLIVPSGQGHSVALGIITALRAWKYQIKKASLQGEAHENV